MPTHDLEIPELRKSRNWSANAGQVTATQTGGFRAIVMAGGTDTLRTFSAASRSGRLHRMGWITAATAGSVVSLRLSPLEFALEDSFSVHYRFKITDPADVTGARMFIGCRNNAGALTNLDPGTLTNVVGIGHNSGETTLRVYGGDGTAGTPVDLGSGFSALGSFAGFFDFSIIGLGSNGVFWRAVAWDDAISGEPSAAASGRFGRAPSPTTAITALTAMRTNNATALAVSLDFAAIHISTL
jgi:hypothetical protein